MSLQPRLLRASVRRLAEALYRSGDLHFLYDAAVLPEEGLQAHRQLAARLGGEAEVPVAHRARSGGYTLRLGGRIDLLQRLRTTHPGASANGALETRTSALRVCEFKSTRSDPERVHAHWASVHWAQVGLYAAMLLAGAAPEPDREAAADGGAEAGAEADAPSATAALATMGEALDAIAQPALAALPVQDVELALHYVHVDTGAERVFRRRASPAELQALLEDACTRWIDRARLRDAWRETRNASLADLGFPHPEYRPRQRALAAAAYRAHRDGTSLLCEAPTGLGKTLSFVFPALKAMAAGYTSRLLYLTARGTGQRSAIAAFATLRQAGARFREVQIVAREKVCLTPGAACAGDACSYARGHHDREPAALAALRESPVASADAVLAVARAHVVCPFALSLAFAREADAVVCDYNYVLDPFVRSARLLADDARNTAVLIDEVHQLPERAQEMHSASLQPETFRAAAVGTPRGTRALLRSIAAEVDALGQRARAAGGLLAGQHEPPTGVVAAGAEALDALALRLTERALPLLAADAQPAFRDAFLTASSWLAVRALAARAPYAIRARDDGSVQRLCIDASALVAQSLAGFRSVQAFSATLPGGAHAPPLGLPSPHLHWQVPTVFAPANMGSFVLADLDVTLKARAATARSVASVVLTTVRARRGNYLVFVPSFAYLQLLAQCFVELAGQAADGGPQCFLQERGSDDAQRMAFLERFRDDGEARVGFAVTGGLFGESVDLPGGALIGVIIVGVALAPPSPERDCLREHLRARGAADADATAYDIPAMVRVRQTAGRLIRTPEDRGVLLLIDARFAQPRFRRWLPEHWAMQPVHMATFAAALADFWARASAADARGGMGAGTIAHSA